MSVCKIRVSEPLRSIRDVEITDAPLIESIYNAAVLSRRSCGHLETITLIDAMDWIERARPTRPMWVVEVNQEVIAWFAVEDFYGLPAFASAVELSIYVATSCQKIGVGRFILEYLLEWSATADISHFVAFVYAHNLASVGLFDAYEFQQWGRLPSIAKIDGQRHDLLILGRVV
jgi:L-amino acid N-acyltransferase YncA